MRRRYQVANFVPWAAVLLIALVVMLPLWGAPPYGDDMRLHIYRIPVVQALWAEGVPFARWLPTLNLGYGSPLFNFYPPLSAYLLTLLYLLVNEQTAVAWNLLLAGALWAGCVGMFLWGRWLYGAAGGVLATALYTWSPHLVYQSFARGSSSNALAMALFPWTAWALTAVAVRPSPLAIVVAGVAVALLMLSHTAASFLFLGPLVVLAGTAVWVAPASRWLGLRAMGLALALGLALSAFSWLPALAEIGATRYAAEAGKVAYQDYFADAFRWPEPTVAGAHNPGLPKTPGMAQMVLGVVGTVLAVLAWRRQTAVRQALVVVSGVMGLGVLVLALAWSGPMWALLPPLQSLQFPWRLLDIPVFCLALAGGFVLGERPGQSRWQWGRLALAAVGLVVAFANVLPYLYPPRLDSLPERLTLAEATAVQQQFGIYGLTAWGEYSTATVTEWPEGLPFAGADEMLPLGDRMVAVPPGVTAVSGDPWRAVWQTNLPQAETITLAVHHFPGWWAWVDGERVAVGVDGDGRIQLTIPPGSHQVELAFSRTPARWLADGLTLVGLAGVVGLLVVGWRRSRGGKGAAADAVSGAATGQPGLVWLLVVLGLLLGVKVVWADRVSSPLVVHPLDGRIPGKVAPEWGVFDDQVGLVAYEATLPGRLVLYWRALADVDGRYRVVVTVADAQGVPLAAVVNDAPGYMSTAHWRAGHLARDVYELPLAGQPGPAGYTLWVGLEDVASGEAVPITDAPGATAVPVGRLKTPPPALDVPETQGALFGEVIRLRQVEMPPRVAAGEPWELTLAWESLAPVAVDYTVFVHLLDAQGGLVAGNDGQPLHGRYPTSFWSPGEIILDVRRWPPELPPGRYQLAVGLYRLDSGERLPVSGPQAAGDRVVLGEVVIED